jgi:hypothetical protein
MKRYSVSGRVFLTLESAARVQADYASPPEIRESEGTPLFVEPGIGGWVLWSDYKVTGLPWEWMGLTPCIPAFPLRLHPVAVEIIGQWRGADDGHLSQVADYLLIEELVTREDLVKRPDYYDYQGWEVERIIIRIQGGGVREIYTVSKGYGEGYYYSAHWSSEAAMRDLDETRPRWAGLSSL